MKPRPVSRQASAPGPQFIRYFGPVIEALQQLGGSARPVEVRDRVVQNLSVSEELQAEVTSNGRTRFDNQVAWARFYLAKVGLIDASRRGVWSLTEKGRHVGPITPTAALELFKTASALFREDKSDGIEDVDAEGERDAPSYDALAVRAGDHRQLLLELLRGLPPSGFERFCQRSCSRRVRPRAGPRMFPSTAWSRTCRLALAAIRHSARCLVTPAPCSARCRSDGALREPVDRVPVLAGNVERLTARE